MKSNEERDPVQIPESLMKAVQGGVTVTDLSGDALMDLTQQRCPYCKQSIPLLNERKSFAGSGTTLRYFMCYNCMKVFEQREYGYESDWGEVDN